MRKESKTKRKQIEGIVWSFAISGASWTHDVFAHSSRWQNDSFLQGAEGKNPCDCNRGCSFRQFGRERGAYHVLEWKLLGWGWHRHGAFPIPLQSDVNFVALDRISEWCRDRSALKKVQSTLGFGTSELLAKSALPLINPRMLVAFFSILGTWDRNIIKYKDDKGEITNLSAATTNYCRCSECRILSNSYTILQAWSLPTVKMNTKWITVRQAQ